MGLTQPTLLNHLRELVEESLLLRGEEGLYPTYTANVDNMMFRMLKEQTYQKKSIRQHMGLEGKTI